MRTAQQSRSAYDDRGAVVIVPMDESGRTVLVYDTEKDGVNGQPVYWKFPGGKIDPPDPSEQAAALRELRGETGLCPERDRILLVGKIHKRSHDVFVFTALVPDAGDIRSVGDEGELVQVFPMEHIKCMANFFPNHKPILEMVERFIKGE